MAYTIFSMKKILTSLVFVAVFIAYVLYQYFGNNTNTLTVSNSGSATTTQTFDVLAQEGPAPLPALVQSTTTEVVNKIKQTVKKFEDSDIVSPTSPPASSKTPIITSTPAPAIKPKEQYADGSYTGIAVDAYYGSVQVEAIVSDGKLIDVVFLKYPSDRRTSANINNQAMLYLKTEAIQAQSANVDTVSGASDTSVAFRESLASALSQAQN
jgi:uncharacterized protein with FMN-binding domain